MSARPRLRWLAIPCLLVTVTAWAKKDDLPFERTEVRSTCDHYDPLKRPFFGETHIHTAYSFDAATIDTRNTTADAYRFAKGEAVGLPPWSNTLLQSDPPPPPPTLPPAVGAYDYCLPPARCEFTATRIAQLPEGRALDWAAITDHAEQLGEGNICMFQPVFPCTSTVECPPEQECATPLARIQDRNSDDPSQKMCVPRGHNSGICLLARDELSRLRTGPAAAIVAGTENGNEIPMRVDFCNATPNDQNGTLCLASARSVWDKIRADAEQAYDRSSACTFTSFIAYEYTAMMNTGRCSTAVDLPCWDQAGKGVASQDCPNQGLCETEYPGSGGLDNMHRNVIFRNDDVLPLPISNIEAPVGCGTNDGCPADRQQYAIGSPQQLLDALKKQCNARPKGHRRCEALSIPHNPNLSGGAMFLMPENLAEAKIRNEMEPLVEMMQVKGASECRFRSEMPGAWGAVDEECAFENMNYNRLNGEWIAPDDRTPENLPPASYVRNTLKNGLQFAAETGVNPFKLGFVGGLDNHSGTPGQSEEWDYARNGAHGIQSFAVSAQALMEKYFLGLETNGGALTVAWAEENSRDAIFSALKNRETYATSGTRPIVRFFGGLDLPADLCAGNGFVERGYADGVPMGGTIARAKKGAVPRFAVSALMDAGWPNHPGTKLQQIQIVKGWIEAATGETMEKVFTIAGDPDNGATVDLATCTPQGAGATSLCGVWSDPDFDPKEWSFYYARVLENPTCRWSQLYCSARGVDCSTSMGICGSTDPAVNGTPCNSNADCATGVCEPPLSYTQFEYEQCCGDKVPQTVQQRAWTSPIWYAPKKGKFS
jgi:hypothetical protein